MTPKEKAIELISKYLDIEDTLAKTGGNLMFKNEAKICALIAVELVLSTNEDESIYGTEFKKYWEQVKIELEKL